MPPNRPKNAVFLSQVTLNFHLDIQTLIVRARDQTCLPCEFGLDLFSGSRDISYTNKKVTDSAKNRTLRSSLRAVIITARSELRKVLFLELSVTFLFVTLTSFSRRL